jgi:hypothetical protein
MHHEYTEETQAKLKALQEVIEQQANRIAELEADLSDAWLEYGRATSLACALNN